MRKVILKVNIGCKKCRQKLMKSISEVPGVQKVEVTHACCPLFIVTGDFKVEEVIKAAEKSKKSVTVESNEEIAPPAPPAKPAEVKPAEAKPAEKPAEAKPAEKPAEAKPAEKPAEAKPAEAKPAKPAEAKPAPAPESKPPAPPKESKPPTPSKPKMPKFPMLPEVGNIIVMVENLIICPQHHHLDCDCCC